MDFLKTAYALKIPGVKFQVGAVSSCFESIQQIKSVIQKIKKNVNM